MTRAVIVVAMFAIVGCATQLQIVGPYANQLSQSDVQQITALITPQKTSQVYTRLESCRVRLALVLFASPIARYQNARSRLASSP
jgi:hypothetical protein